MMHAAESQAEKAFMIDGTGAFAEGLRKRNIEWQPPGISTVQYLMRQGIMETKPLLAHCVTVDDQDIETIRSAGASVAHCPKSNAKLHHGRAPFAKFLNASVKAGFGSDSVASNNNCDIIEEARFALLSARGSDTRADSITLNAETALFTATLGGARALGVDNQVGSLTEGLQADLTVVGLDDIHQQPVKDPIHTLIFSSSGHDVRMTMVAGKEVYRDGQVVAADELALTSRREISTPKKRMSSRQVSSCYCSPLLLAVFVFSRPRHARPKTGLINLR